MKILYIHGFEGSPNGRTGSFVNRYFVDDTVIAPEFDLLDYESALSEIRSIVKSENISIVIGHSLGGFYALSLRDEDIFTIAINPCMVPSIEIPKLVEDGMPDSWVRDFERHENEMSAHVPGAIRQGTFGIFGAGDELFSHSDLFTDIFGASSVGGGLENKSIVSGGHTIPDSSLEEGFNDALEYFSKLDRMISGDFLDESANPLNEHFVNVDTGKDDPNVEKYKKPIFDLLQKVYKSVGGVSGLDKPDDLVKDSDFWKIDRKGDEIKAVAIYTFKRGGRKLQYIGSDGTDEGKKRLYRMIKDDVNRHDRHAWAEVSGAVEHTYLKHGAVPVDLDTVKKILHDKTIHPVEKDDPLAKREKNDVFDGFHYKRKIGGNEHIKLMVINIPDSTKKETGN